MALADRWWAAAEKVRGKGKFEWKKAARHWYEKAQPGLSGLNKTRVEARLREIESAESPVTSSPRRLISRIAANGLALSATFDCTKTAEKVPFNEAFNIQTNWLLALKFSTAAWEGGSHMMLHCGDGRLGHDSLWLALHRERLEVGIGDSGADKQFRLSSQLTPQDVGRWVDVVVRYNALRSELSLYVDDKLVASEKSTVVPAVDRPMPMWIGGEHEDAQRFHGQVREVWLGNLQ
jgi:hypothetical protein